MVDGDDKTGGEHEYGEAVVEGSGEHPQPGDIIIDPDLAYVEQPLVGDGASSPLEEDEPEGNIPPSPLWAMKMRRHIQWHLLPSHERHERLRAVTGAGDDVVYVIDDGAHHVMLGRRVGRTDDGCEYCIVARAPRKRYDELARGGGPPPQAFEGAAEIRLVGLAQEEDIISSNIFDVTHYDSAADIPDEYRPGQSYLLFTSDPEITVDGESKLTQSMDDMGYGHGGSRIGDPNIDPNLPLT